PPRQADEGNDDVVAAGQKRQDDERARQRDRRIVVSVERGGRGESIPQPRRIEEERIVVGRGSNVLRQRSEEGRVGFAGQQYRRHGVECYIRPEQYLEA